MWICRNCGTENEENFKFCWGCGNSKVKAEIISQLPPQPVKPKPIEKNPELQKQIKRVEKIPELPNSVEKIPEVKEKNHTENKLFEASVTTQVEPRANIQKFDEDVMPMFSRVAGVENSPSSEDFSLQRKIFTIAVRLVGLFFLYQVLIALPDLVVLIKNSAGASAEFSDALTDALIIPAAKIIFYFVIGIYLIASGKILLWLLPDR